MINQADNPVEWALLVTDLEEACEHLQSLIDQMATDGQVDESDFAVQMGHIYAHLNRDWHARNLGREMTDAESEQFTRYPRDLEPVG